MTTRGTSLALSMLVLLAACGGSNGDNSGSSTADASATTAAPAQEPSSTAIAPAASTAASVAAPTETMANASGGTVVDGAPIDPATGELCDVLDVASMAAALGVAEVQLESSVDDSDVMAECTYRAADVGMIVQVMRQMGPESVRAEGVPLGVGETSYVFELEGRRFADLAINGWYVILGQAGEPPTDAQFTTVGQLLVARLVGRENAPTLAPPTANEPGSCTVEITGGVNLSYTGTQRVGEGYAEAWVSPEQVAAADAAFPGGTGAPDFQVGCTNEAGGSFLVMLFDTPVALGSTAVPVPVNQAGYFADDVILGNTDPFDITLTTFDENRMVGSFSFAATQALSGSAPSTVTVTFDFARGI